MEYTLFKEITVPDECELYFVGDLHGCYNLLEKGIKDLGIKDSDYVISVGDLLDRGDANFKCVEHFYNKPNRFAVLGNHEWMMIEGALGGHQEWGECWITNGGATTISEVGLDGVKLLAEMVKTFPVALKVYHRNKIYGVVHGGVPLRYKQRGLEYADVYFNEFIKNLQNENEVFNAIWDRDAIEAGQYHIRRGETLPHVQGVDYVFHGHTGVKDMEVYANRVYIDTGSVFTNKLCFAWVEGDELKHYKTGDWDE